MSKTPVGIDLGTSFSAAAYIDEAGEPRLVLNALGERLTASVVRFGDDRVMVGEAFSDSKALTEDRCAEYAKRDMGAPTFHQPIGGANYPPEVVQACVLRQLRRDVIEGLGEEFGAVVAVPAYFDEHRRKATWDAAIISGLPLVDIVNEPTAAALAFGQQLGYLSPEGAPVGRLNVLVYDLGGGTFDVSIIRLTASEIRTLATDGDSDLGGLNWDERIAELARARLQDLDPHAVLSELDLRRLQHAAERVKHQLSESPLAVLEFEHASGTLKLPIEREDFEDLTADLLERTIFTTRQALGAAGMVWDQIDRLLLVGGSSRMPAVRRRIYEESGILPDQTVDPDEAVARGAAVYARYLLGKSGGRGSLPKLRIIDVNSHSLGLEGVNLETLRTENVFLIPRNTPLPCEVKRTVVTRVENQPSVKVQLLEGESKSPAHCARLATATRGEGF
jgi:molecular chaperone DnaK